MEQARKDNSRVDMAMKYGLILGLFWSFKYMAYAGAAYWKHFIYLYYLLSAGTFLLIYIYYFKYRDSESGKQKTRGQCIGFIVLLCVFAGLVEVAARYLHIQLINPSYFYDNVEPILRGLGEGTAIAFKYPEELKATYLSMVTSKPFYLISEFFGNVFLGGFLGLIFSWIIGNKKLN